MRQKEFAATPTPLGIEDEEEVTYQSAPITQPSYATNTKRSASKTAERDASKATKRSTGETTEGDAGKAAKEVQVKPQKRCKRTANSKRKTVCYSKPPVIEKQNRRKKNTKFSVNVLPRPPQPPIKPKKNIKFQM